MKYPHVGFVVTRWKASPAGEAEEKSHRKHPGLCLLSANRGVLRGEGWGNAAERISGLTHMPILDSR